MRFPIRRSPLTSVPTTESYGGSYVRNTDGEATRNALEKRGLTRGIAAICIGGGEGTAIAIERV